MRYVPNSLDERHSMLRDIGCERIEELFDQVPKNLRVSEPLGIGESVSEPELIALFRELASKNAADYDHFLGGGAYSHFIPVVIDSLISRSEFFTAYTPYQPELSQGTLQYIFEFQTMVCQLTGMEVANASVYDGSTALAEAVLMAARITRREKFLLGDSVHPQYREVVSSYVRNLGFDVQIVEHSGSGAVDSKALAPDRETAALVVQSPNFFGCVENLADIAAAAHEAGALLIVAVSEPISFGILNPPGACDADIVVAEGQSFGIPLSFGGPYLGLFASLEKHMRQMPGRLVGEAYDEQGRRGFVLTLSTREQHIRREKATSNICTNQGLCALMATIYLAAMGRRGINEVARLNLQKAHYAAREIGGLRGYRLKFNAPFFNEFVIDAPVPAAQIKERLLEKKIIPGISLESYYPDMENSLLVCVTETSSKAKIDRMVAALGEF